MTDRTPQAEPEAVVDQLTRGLAEALGHRLVSLAVHGSYAAVDFSPARSDLDLVAVVTDEPDATVVATVGGVLDRTVADHPDWADRIEIDGITAACVADLLASAPTGHVMLRVAPGEPLRLQPATRHYLVNWYSALRADRPLVGPRLRTVLPDIPHEEALDVLRGHVRSWPGWVLGSDSPGFCAYAVMTVGRALATLAGGRHVSKRQGAAYVREHHPAYASLATWAERWWYDGGGDDDVAPHAEVVGFVTDLGNRVPPGGRTAP